MSHLKAWQFSGLADRSLSGAALLEAKAHLDDCPVCRQEFRELFSDLKEYEMLADAGLLEKAPPGAVNRARELTGETGPGVWDILIDFSQKVEDRIRTTLWDVVPPVLPAYAMRSDDSAAPEKGTLVLKRMYDRFEVSVQVVRVESGRANIDLSIVDRTRNELPSLRAGLFSGDDKVNSVAIRDGNADFREIAMGDYTVKIWDRSGDRIALTLSMKG